LKDEEETFSTAKRRRGRGSGEKRRGLYSHSARKETNDLLATLNKKDMKRGRSRTDEEERYFAYAILMGKMEI